MTALDQFSAVTLHECDAIYGIQTDPLRYGELLYSLCSIFFNYISLYYTEQASFLKFVYSSCKELGIQTGSRTGQNSGEYEIPRMIDEYEQWLKQNREKESMKRTIVAGPSFRNARAQEMEISIRHAAEQYLTPKSFRCALDI